MPTKAASMGKKGTPITTQRIGVTQATYDRLVSLSTTKKDTFESIIVRLLDGKEGKG